jgi:hypothetical protein
MSIGGFMITTPHTRPFTYPVTQEYAALGLDPTKISALYMFDPAGNLYDASGNERHGTTDFTSFTDGRYGNGGEFDGINDCSDVDDAVFVGNSGAELSVAVWHFAESQAGTNKTLAAQWDNGDGNKKSWEFFRNGAATTLQISIDDGADNLQKAYSRNTAINADAWNHLVFTFDGNASFGGVTGYLRMFSNSVEIAQGDMVKTANENTSIIPQTGDATSFTGTNMAIGCRWDTYPTGQRFVAGAFDIVLIYGAVLTPNMINNLFNAGL